MLQPRLANENVCVCMTLVRGQRKGPVSYNAEECAAGWEVSRYFAVMELQLWNVFGLFAPDM